MPYKPIETYHDRSLPQYFCSFSKWDVKIEVSLCRLLSVNCIYVFALSSYVENVRELKIFEASILFHKMQQADI